MIRKIVVNCVAALALLSMGEARAQYGAHASVNLTVSELKTRDVDGYKLTGYDAELTWTGSCVSGDYVDHWAGITSTGPTYFRGGETMPAGKLTGGGSHKDETITPGQVLYGWARATCLDSGGTETHEAKTVPVVLPPYIPGMPTFMTSSPPEFFNCFPIDTEVQVLPIYENSFAQDEELEIVFKGAGIDFSQRFKSSSEINNTPIKVKATSAGEVEYWVAKVGRFESFGFNEKSNVVKIKADTHANCSTKGKGKTDSESDPDPDGENELDPNDGDELDPGTSSPDESESGFGCSSAAGAPRVVAFGLLVALSLRRRRG